MRALWSYRQNCSHNVSQNFKRIRRAFLNKSCRDWMGGSCRESVQIAVILALASLVCCPCTDSYQTIPADDCKTRRQPDYSSNLCPPKYFAILTFPFFSSSFPFLPYSNYVCFGHSLCSLHGKKLPKGSEKRHMTL